MAEEKQARKEGMLLGLRNRYIFLHPVRGAPRPRYLLKIEASMGYSNPRDTGDGHGGERTGEDGIILSMGTGN